MKKFILGLVLVLSSVGFSTLGALAQQAPALVDLNSATVQQVNALPGVGNKLAAEIVKNRPYSSLDDLNAKVKISKKSLDKIRPLVSFGAAPATASSAAAPVAAAAATTAVTTTTAATASKPAKASSKTATAANPVNVNTATKEQLMTIPEVGPKMADAIIANRPYKDMNEMIAKVKGIGPKNSVKLAPFMRF